MAHFYPTTGCLLSFLTKSHRFSTTSWASSRSSIAEGEARFRCGVEVTKGGDWGFGDWCLWGNSRAGVIREGGGDKLFKGSNTVNNWG